MKRGHNIFARIALSLLCIILALILVVMLSVTFYFRHLMNQINYVNNETTPSLSQEELDAYLATDEAEEEAGDSEIPTMAPEDVVFEEHDTQIDSTTSNIINILLIGQDRRPGEERARSDVMILCTFNKDTKTMAMTSFLRDLYVQIPGYLDNRLNAAYAAGGMSLLRETLKINFGIEVDGCVEVDFTRFSQIVDLLGGVSIDLRSDEANTINKSVGYASLSSGVQLLNGDQALAYARIRKLDSDGDFSRTERQRKVINALIQKYKNSSLTSLMSLLEEALPMITTDLKDTDIIGYATDLFSMLPDMQIVSQRIPADGTYSGRMIRNMSVLVADLDAARQLLEETLLGSGS